MNRPVDAQPDTGLAHASGPARAVVSVRGLTKRYGDVLAVDEVSFTLTSGTVTGFLGPNGAGKSTTLRMLLGSRTLRS